MKYVEKIVYKNKIARPVLSFFRTNKAANFLLMKGILPYGSKLGEYAAADYDAYKYTGESNIVKNLASGHWGMLKEALGLAGGAGAAITWNTTDAHIESSAKNVMNFKNKMSAQKWNDEGEKMIESVVSKLSNRGKDIVDRINLFPPAITKGWKNLPPEIKMIHSNAVFKNANNEFNPMKNYTRPMEQSNMSEDQIFTSVMGEKYNNYRANVLVHGMSKKKVNKTIQFAKNETESVFSKTIYAPEEWQLEFAKKMMPENGGNYEEPYAKLPGWVRKIKNVVQGFKAMEKGRLLYEGQVGGNFQTLFDKTIGEGVKSFDKFTGDLAAGKELAKKLVRMNLYAIKKYGLKYSKAVIDNTGGDYRASLKRIAKFGKTARKQLIHSWNKVGKQTSAFINNALYYMDKPNDLLDGMSDLTRKFLGAGLRTVDSGLNSIYGAVKKVGTSVGISPSTIKYIKKGALGIRQGITAYYNFIDSENRKIRRSGMNLVKRSVSIGDGLVRLGANTFVSGVGLVKDLIGNVANAGAWLVDKVLDPQTFIDTAENIAKGLRTVKNLFDGAMEDLRIYQNNVKNEWKKNKQERAMKKKERWSNSNFRRNVNTLRRKFKGVLQEVYDEPLVDILNDL